jgi:dihydrolipoamide dehydrogenase
MMPQLLPGEDAEVVEELGKSLKRQGINVYTGVKLQEIGRGQDKEISARLSSGDELKADMVLVAVGRVPDTGNIGAEGLNLLDEKGFIRVDEKMRTSSAGIYAVGDAVGGMLLAHKASEEGVVAAENALGLDAKMDYGIIPRCIFTQPEIACVGVSEETARAEGKELKIGRFPFSALGKARASGETEGMVKIISDAATDEIFGIHIVGAGATDLIGEAALAMKLEATAEDIAGTIHPHPTFGEALKEASLAVDGKAIHI